MSRLRRQDAEDRFKTFAKEPLQPREPPTSGEDVIHAWDECAPRPARQKDCQLPMTAEDLEPMIKKERDPQPERVVVEAVP